MDRANERVDVAHERLGGGRGIRSVVSAIDHRFSRLENECRRSSADGGQKPRTKIISIGPAEPQATEPAPAPM